MQVAKHTLTGRMAITRDYGLRARTNGLFIVPRTRYSGRRYDDKAENEGTPVRGYAINSLGDACGSSGSPSLPIYKPFDGPVQSLNLVRNTTWGRAMDINDSGQCVGQIETVSKSNSYALSAYLWQAADAGPVELEKLIDKKSGWDILSYANYINNKGAMAGNGYYAGVATGFIMIPTP